MAYELYESADLGELVKRKYMKKDRTGNYTRTFANGTVVFIDITGGIVKAKPRRVYVHFTTEKQFKTGGCEIQRLTKAGLIHEVPSDETLDEKENIDGQDEEPQMGTA